MAAKTLSSPLVSTFNNIAKVGASAKMASKLQSDFMGFMNFIDQQNAELNRIELPEERKIKRLGNLNIASTFGSPGGLLSSLASGALDLAGFLGNFFPGRGKQGKPQKATTKGIKEPKITPKGKRLRFGGMKGLGVLNALFTGLDFYQGLQEGESVGKAATGAGASLAGSIIGGVLGSALGPLGAFAGASLGGMVGGWVGDRAYEATAERGGGLKQRQEQRLKEQEAKQKSLRGDKSFSEVINKFSLAVERFERGISQGLFATLSQQGEEPMEDAMGEVETNYDGQEPSVNDVREVYKAEGGDDPSSHFTSGFGWRWGRMHNGVDFAHPNPSSPVTILQPGTVDTGYEGGYGNWVAVKHNDGAETFYAHLSKVNVKKGQRIDAGTVIGNQGNTGRSRGAHVHFEYRPAGPGTKPVDGRGAASKYFRFGGKITVKPRKGSDVGEKMGDAPTNYPQNQEQQKVNQPIKPAQPKTQTNKNIQSTQTTPINNAQMMNPADYVMAASQQMTAPQQANIIQYYPSYDRGQSVATIMPILIGNNSPNQRPVVISGGSGGEVVVIPPPSEGEIVNNLMKTMLLTNLSGS